MERFYWHRVHKDSKHFAEAYPDCQANKADHNKFQGKLHPLPAPERSWKHVTMNFFFDLPTADGGYNGVLLVVDRFSKLVKLIPFTKDVSASKVAQLYLKVLSRRSKSDSQLEVLGTDARTQGDKRKRYTEGKYGLC
jgi:hypothetical protein